MSGPDRGSSAWGEPAQRAPLIVTSPPDAPASGPAAKPRPRTVAANPYTRVISRRERIRAAATLAFVAIILGAGAAGLLGVMVWAIAALFHHAASG